MSIGNISLGVLGGFTSDQSRQIKSLDFTLSRTIDLTHPDVFDGFITRVRSSRWAWKQLTDVKFREDVESVHRVEDLPYLIAELKSELRSLHGTLGARSRT